MSFLRLRLTFLPQHPRLHSGHPMLSVHIKDLADHTLLIFSLQYHIYKTVLQKELCSLKALGQLLSDGLLDDPGACKADQGMRLCDNNIAQHGKACSHSACGWICKYADKELSGLMVAL